MNGSPVRRENGSWYGAGNQGRRRTGGRTGTHCASSGAGGGGTFLRWWPGAFGQGRQARPDCLARGARSGTRRVGKAERREGLLRLACLRSRGARGSIGFRPFRHAEGGAHGAVAASSLHRTGEGGAGTEFPLRPRRGARAVFRRVILCRSGYFPVCGGVDIRPPWRCSGPGGYWWPTGCSSPCWLPACKYRWRGRPARSLPYPGR